MNEILFKSLFAGVGISLAASPVGCFILWQRMSNFGDSLAHAALFSVVFATIFEFDLTISIIALCSLISFLLIILKHRQNQNTSSTTILAIVSHGSIALSLVITSLFENVRFNLSNYLFAGDILSVSVNDIFFIYFAAFLILIWFFSSWKTLLSSIISPEISSINGVNVKMQEMQFSIILSVIIAIFIKFVGILLISAMLIVPAAAARNLSHGPLQMILITGIIGVSSVILGISASFSANTPTGPTIVLITLAFFVTSLFLDRKKI